VHIFTEEAFLDRDALLDNQVGYFFVELLCQLRLGGVVEAWASALSAIAVKGKIAYQQNRTADVKQVPIHLSILVREDTQVHELFGDELGIFDGVIFADAEVNEQSFIYLANRLAIDFNLCL
jgi:hypothetical protein